jgi:hypothetical protein
MTALRRTYSAGHFELIIDGHVSTAYLKSVEGGFVRTAPLDEPIGPDLQRIKHSNVVEIEPFSLDCGFAGAGDVLRWLQASWRKDFNRRNGQITHAGFDLKKTFEHEFFDALITEAAFPTLETTAKEPAFLKLKIQPERIASKKSSSGSVQGTITPKQKLWNPAAFRFNIDGLDPAIMKYVSKVEGFTIKQGIKKFYTGNDRFPQIEPTKIDFPNLTCTMPVEFADPIIKWYDDYVVKGQSDLKAQKTGSIEYLSPDRKDVLFAINLYEMGIVHGSILPSPANADQIKKYKFELYVGRMDIDGSGNLGLE